ncbi:MAG: hypothetical protein K2Q03_04095 [Sphingobacteriaceae bacterium]|nr:hypothetical protein [Sphingobacteriaceae bacterium]
MKIVKITLAIIVIGAITVAILWGFMSVSDSGKIQVPQNQFTNKIEEKIDALTKVPESSFCKESYNDIKYYIEDDYSNNRFGNTQSENDQWKENLSNQLYAAYSEKFIEQAFYVFKGSDWELKKLAFIRSEYQDLQKYGREAEKLEKNSRVDEKLNEITNIFAKYDEITGFINSFTKLSISNYADLNNEFPVYKASNMIIRSKKYLKNNLENKYVKNCRRLKTSLSAGAQILFKTHVKYLDNKITYWSGRYDKYSSQKEYYDILFSPLKNEIDNLYNDIYIGINLDTEYAKLEGKLKEDSSNAYEYFQ